MNRNVCLLILALGTTGLMAIDPPTRTVPVNLTHERGSFSGELVLSMTGTHEKAQIAWKGTIKNISPHRIFRVTFCVKPIGADKQEIKPGGNECALRMWGTNWDSGSVLTFKGNQKIKISQEKTPLQVAEFKVGIEEIFDHAPNLRELEVRCPLVWSAAIRVFADKRFRPTVLDKDSFTATYAYEGGRIDGLDAKTMLKAHTNANTAFMGPIWESFRIDSASLYLREIQAGTCTAEVKMSFAGFGKPFLGNYGWYAVDSNFNFEKSILDAVETQSKKEAELDTDKAISRLPTGPPKPSESETKPQLTITSEPTGAEIEIDGEYIGSTPTTMTAKEGSLSVLVKKNGYQPWQRQLKLKSGDKRTVHAELVK